MNNKSRIIESAIIAVALIVLGFSLKAGIDNFANRDKVVSVKGLAEMEVAANKVTWPIPFKAVGNSLPELYNSIDNTQKTIIAFLKNGGISDSEISVNPPEVVDMQAEMYTSNDRNYRYNITAVITVTSTQVDRVRQLMVGQSSLLKDGVAIVKGGYENPVVYEYTSFNEIKPKMIEEATKNARSAAERFAKDSDCSIGEIVRANQGQFSIEDRDAYTPYIKKIRVVTSITYALD